MLTVFHFLMFYFILLIYFLDQYLLSSSDTDTTALKPILNNWNFLLVRYELELTNVSRSEFEHLLMCLGQFTVTPCDSYDEISYNCRVILTLIVLQSAAAVTLFFYLPQMDGTPGLPACSRNRTWTVSWERR